MFMGLLLLHCFIALDDLGDPLLVCIRPLDSLALMKSDMSSCMRALRNNQELLLTVMDVFIKEPQLDWINEARRTKNTGSGSVVKDSSSSSHQNPSTSLHSQSVDVSWVPKQKITTAVKKLRFAPFFCVCGCSLLALISIFS
jgi:hypothetical protein